MAHRIAILSAGRLQQVGSPQEVYEAPANLFVAQFIGTPPMNTLNGTFTTEGGPAIVVGESRFPVPADLKTRLEEGQGVIVGARPEHLDVSDAGTITHDVRAVEWLGHECLVFGSVEGSPVVVREAGWLRSRRAAPSGSRSTPPTSTSSIPTPRIGWRERGRQAAGRDRRVTRPRRLRSRWHCWCPSIAVFVAFFYRPFLNLLYWGTFESRANGAFFERVGLRQYREQLTSSDFREGLWHSVQFVLYTVPAGLVLGILLAVAAHRRLRGIKVFQAIFSSTLASSVAVTSVIFLYLLHPVVGVFRVDWLTNPDTAMFAVSLSSIWQNIGPVVHHRPRRPAERARRGDGGRHPRRLRPGAPAAADHPSAHLAGADVPAGGAGDLRPAGLRPGRHPHRRRTGR